MYNKFKTIPYDIFMMFKKVHSRIPYHFGNGYAFYPLRVNIEVTHRCNLICEMCYIKHQSETKNIKIKKQDELTKEEIGAIINKLPSKLSIISFSGGEPFIRKDFIEILRNACRNYKCNVTTNATLINENMAEELVDMGVTSINVSIDGTEEIHDKIRGIKGSFKKSTDTIIKIQEIKKRKSKKYPFINIKNTMTANNVHMFSEILYLAEDLDANFCSFQIMNNSINTSSLDLKNELKEYSKRPSNFENFNIKALEKQLEIIKEKTKRTKVKVRFLPEFSIEEIINHYSNNIDLKKYTCHTPWSLMCISPYGDVFPCLNFKIGNCREDNILGLFNNMNYKKFRNNLKKTNIFPSCIGCCYIELTEKK